MNIEFDRTIDDVMDFNLFHMAHSPSIKRQLLLIQILVGMLTFAFVIGFCYLNYHSINVILLIISILAGIIAFAIYPQVARRSTINRIRTMLSEGNNQAMLGHQLIILSPEGVFGKNQTAESKINWSAIYKVVQSDKHFFLYTSSLNAMVIPQNCFSSEMEKQEFLEYVNRYYQPK